MTEGSNMILFDRQDDLIKIVLNRPEKRNALNHEMRLALLDFLEDDSTNNLPVYFTGNGPCFSAGLDIKEDLTEVDLGDFTKIIDLLRTYPGETKAYIDGTVRGGGLILARSCDFLFASPQSNFSIPTLSFSQNPHVKSALQKYISENPLFLALSQDDSPWSADMALESGLIDAIYGC